ncbi:hypothetical protein FE257_011283 [Aspergillus nanangensis]|uniref:RNA polymerase I specific transcription initiation factor RRN3 superfamily n=1 Tax=Aspergillus nanangensis TaxID=2582783 RepID=A0AAD4CI51_ASPNN|nr:hypothetical protein FE257_011283 [Aspergillus nanangensis]
MVSSPVSILKKTPKYTPTSNLKHNMDDMNLSFSASPSIGSDGEYSPSPRKRPRVQFTAKNMVFYEDPPEKSAAVVREEVRRAIQRHVSGTDSGAYDLLKEIFSMDPRKQEERYAMDTHELPTPTSLRNHLLGLLSNVAALDRSCNGLVQAVLYSVWLGRDESYVKLFTRFLGNLAAAQSPHLGSVLKMLVTYLGALPRDTGKVPGYDVVPVTEVYRRVHAALRRVMQLVPSSSGALSPIMSINFPFETDSAKANIAYTRNLLHIVKYAPELQADILALVTEKLVKIDVQIQVDMDDVEDELGEEMLQEVSPEDAILAEDDDDDDEGSIFSDDSLEENPAYTLKDNILKLDGMLDLLFEFYSPSFTTGTLNDQQGTLALLFSHFERIILPTYRSRHSQFLLFHFTQTAPAFVILFTGECIEMLFNKAKPAIMRQSIAAYLASFIARGAHIPSEVVRDVFSLLGELLYRLQREYLATCSGPDLRRYGPFYSIAQALLYIFCFRWRDLTTAAVEGDTPDQVDELEPEDIAFPPFVKEILLEAVHSKLNPLKVCAPVIVEQFARLTQYLNFIYVYSIIEANKRLRISSFRSLAVMADPRFSQVERERRAGDDLGHQLDAYFPFDPYQLPRSRRWVTPDYNEWRGIPGDHDDSDSEASESDEDGAETDEE